MCEITKSVCVQFASILDLANSHAYLNQSTHSVHRSTSIYGLQNKTMCVCVCVVCACAHVCACVCVLNHKVSVGSICKHTGYGWE